MLNFGQNGNMPEKRIIDLIVSDFSWEQILYDIVAAEGMDPWNVDIAALSTTFLNYLNKIKDLDFRVPAKFIIIASLFLRMKSDNLRLADVPGEEIEGDMVEEPNGYHRPTDNGESQLMAEAMSFPINRRPTKGIAVTDLIFALKKVMDTQQRKDFRIGEAQSMLTAKMESITQRINSIYAKIDGVMAKLKNEEVKFSSIVEKWDRGTIIDTFMPVVYLDHEKKVQCRQDQYFDEIFIRKLNGHTNGSSLNSHSLMPQTVSENNNSQNHNTELHIKPKLGQKLPNTLEPDIKLKSNSKIPQNHQPKIKAAIKAKLKNQMQNPFKGKSNIKIKASFKAAMQSPQQKPEIVKDKIKSKGAKYAKAKIKKGSRRK